MAIKDKRLKAALDLADRFHPGVSKQAGDYVATYEKQVGVVDPVTILTIISAIISFLNVVDPSKDFAAQLMAFLKKLLPMP